MVAGALAERHRPDVVAGVEIDRHDPAERRLEERQAPGTEHRVGVGGVADAERDREPGWIQPGHERWRARGHVEPAGGRMRAAPDQLAPPATPGTKFVPRSLGGV